MVKIVHISAIAQTVLGGLINYIPVLLLNFLSCLRKQNYENQLTYVKVKSEYEVGPFWHIV